MPHQLKTTLSQTAFTEDGGETECRIEIEPDQNQNRRLPLHIVFCVDQSYSMAGEEMRLAKRGIKNAMSSLDSRDTFGVVAFNDSANIVAQPTSGDRTYTVNIDNINASGGTNIIDGLEASQNLLERMSSSGLPTGLTHGGQDSIRWIALVTDGQPGSIKVLSSTHVSGLNRDVTGSAIKKHGAVAEVLNERGITIHTAGVGNSYGEGIIEALSSRSGGTWEHHSSAAGIENFFKTKIQEAHNVVITNPTLTIEPKNGVDIDRLRRVVPQITDVKYKKRMHDYVVTDFPDIRKDIAPEYICNLKIPSHETEGDVPFADITLDIGTKTLCETVSGDFLLDNSLAIDLDEGKSDVKKEADTADTYLGHKNSMDRQTKEEQSNSIKNKRL